MSIEAYKRLKRDNSLSLSGSPISTYCSSNVPIFSPRRTMSLAKTIRGRNVSHHKFGRSVSVQDSKDFERPTIVEAAQVATLESIKSAIIDTGKYIWEKVTGSTIQPQIEESFDTKIEFSTNQKVYSRKHGPSEYFFAPKKARKVVELDTTSENELQGEECSKKSEEHFETETILSFSMDPFNWTSWKTTEISPSSTDRTDLDTPQYGTTLRRKKRNTSPVIKQNQLVVRGQSEEIEYLRMIFNGAYKVPKLIEDEREGQMKLMEADSAGSRKVKGSIIDLTEKIKNILLESSGQQSKTDDDLIFVSEHKVSPLERKRQELQHKQLRFDRSVLEFEKEFKNYRQLLEERKHVQDEVRRKKELNLKKNLIPDIQGSQMNAVQKVWNRQENGVIVNKDNLELSVRDFKTLTPKRWLNDTVIEFFMKFIEKNSDKTVAFNSFFYTNLSERGYQSVRRWMKRKKFQINDLDKIFVPINLNQSHWALGMIDITRKKIVYVDSLSNGPNAVSFAILSDLQKYVTEESKNTLGSDFEIENLPCPQQPNGFDCGIYLCLNALYLSHDAPLTFNREDAVKMRTYIAHLILSADN